MLSEHKPLIWYQTQRFMDILDTQHTQWQWFSAVLLSINQKVLSNMWSVSASELGDLHKHTLFQINLCNNFDLYQTYFVSFAHFTHIISHIIRIKIKMSFLIIIQKWEKGNKQEKNLHSTTLLQKKLCPPHLQIHIPKP